ncbi:substrate-binding domain-containing protein [Cohnella cellulosilytica]|uniref:Substrate-binding domain-containing protein n=1 Tax=Cohnella cellulosilytica TaxID=986710 RepID=A0ABW2FBN2_9BACL
MIIDDILSNIEKKQFSYDKPICTEKSLSEQYGVSRITSKRAIDELENAGVLYRKRGVGSFVRRRSSAETAAASAPSVGALPGKLIPFVLPFAITQGGILRAIEVATRQLSEHGWHLSIHVCEPSEEEERKLLLRLLGQNVDGLIFYPSAKELHRDILQKFTESGKRVIILDKPHDIDYLSSIVCDNFNGAYMLTQHLIDYGHRNIAYLSRFSSGDLTSIRDRYEGFDRCMADNGLTPNPEFVRMNLSSDYHMLKHVINTLFKAGVTAIECENDEVAFNVYMCCRSLSIQVPAQMNIAGFDNIEWAVTGSAQITTVDQNFARIGETMADMLLSEDNDPSAKVIPVHLIPRTSTSPIAN